MTVRPISSTTFAMKGQKCYPSGSWVRGHDGIETMFKAMKSAGFNIEDNHLSDIKRIEKFLLLVMMAFVWCYNIEEFVYKNLKPIRILKHGRKTKSIFRYGLDIVTEFLTRGRNDYGILIFSFLSTDNLIFTPA